MGKFIIEYEGKKEIHEYININTFKENLDYLMEDEKKLAFLFKDIKESHEEIRTLKEFTTLISLIGYKIGHIVEYGKVKPTVIKGSV